MMGIKCFQPSDVKLRMSVVFAEGEVNGLAHALPGDQCRELVSNMWRAVSDEFTNCI